MLFLFQIWTLFCCLQVLKTVDGSGTVEIRFLKFINSEGAGSNGHCCDGRGPFCFSDCDHKFKICVDDASGPDNIHTCPYFGRTSGEFVNSNSITFGSAIAGIPNPIKVTFDYWPGELKLKVEVWDVDDNSNDHVDFLSGIISLKASKSENEADMHALQIRRRTLLTYNVKVYCDEHYFGEHCDTYCNPSEQPVAHYACDSTTGLPICDEGWSGELCNENNRNECLDLPCNSSQQCVDTPSGYQCICPDGFAGHYCNESINATCTIDTCLNGGVCDVIHGQIVCACADGFLGLICELEIDICGENTCHNNGTCSFNASTIECICPSGFSGPFCEVAEEESRTNIFVPSNMTINETYSTNSTVELTTIMPVALQDSTAELTTTMPVTLEHSTVLSTESTTTLTSKTPFYPSLTVRGRIDKHNQESVGKGLRNFMYDHITIINQLYLDIKYKVKKNLDGDIVSEIIIESAFDGTKQINASIIQHVFDDTPSRTIENYIIMPVVRQRPAVAHSHEIDFHDSWMHNYWYVVVILVFGVVCFIIAIGIFILYKRRKFVVSENKEVPSNNANVTQPASSSQSFENSLYFEVKKQNNQGSDNLGFSAMP